MKSMLRHVTEGDQRYDALAFICPGCLAAEQGTGLHMLPVNSTWKTPAWTWDGNLDAPTLSPSILSSTGPFGEHGKPEGVCHSFLKAGVFEFLGDCTHPFAGQSVPMVDLPDWFTHESTDG